MVSNNTRSARKTNKKNRLTSAVGRLIDALTYDKIILAICSQLFIVATYFWIASEYGNGTNISDISWWNALYFSVITFTSLGYGDILPIGFGRFVASFNVIWGLLLTAIFIGKIASERQSAMLRLIYTSDNQRRIVEFESEISIISDQLKQCYLDHSHDLLTQQTKRAYTYVASLNSYLVFQANQGNLAYAGNASSLRRMYRSLNHLFDVASLMLKTHGIPDQTRIKIQQLADRILIIATKMAEFCDEGDKKTLSALQGILISEMQLNVWKVKIKSGKALYEYRSEITPVVLQKILAEVPPRPWSKHFHKTIASNLGIHNRLVAKTLEKLKLEGRI